MGRYFVKMCGSCEGTAGYKFPMWRLWYVTTITTLKASLLLARRSLWIWSFRTVLMGFCCVVSRNCILLAIFWIFTITSLILRLIGSNFCTRKNVLNVCSILSISVASTVWTLIKHKVEFLEELGTADRGWRAEEGDSAPELDCWGRWVGPLVWQSRLFTWSHWALITPKLGQVMARAGNISQVYLFLLKRGQHVSDKFWFQHSFLPLQPLGHFTFQSCHSPQ